MSPHTKQLRIGYLWQSDQFSVNKNTATHLHIRAVSSQLEAQGHQVRLVTLPQGCHQWSDDWEQWQPAPLGFTERRFFRLGESAVRGAQARLHLPYLNLFASYRFAQAVINSCADRDILYERYWLLNTGGMLAARRLGIPIILEVNGDLFEEYEQLEIDLTRAQWQAVRLLNRVLFHQVDHVITVSEPLRQRMVERWSLRPEKVTTVHNGANIQLFTSTNGSAVQADEGNDPIIAFVGTFKPWHGLDLLLEAFAIVASRHSTSRLLLVGDGPLRGTMERRTKELGLSDRVTFSGKVAQTEVAALLQRADVAVVNPRFSPAAMVQSPLKVFEYMAAGKAVVAPAMPNIQDILVHGKTGYLVTPDDPEALAEGILTCLCDEQLRHELGKNAHEQAVTRHSWEDAVLQIEAIMRRLVA